ncbi:MAG TPA: hypothetical protein VG917_05850 [Patescibacteria group bacterium]|nr:hypothetical protein [Patescibacteria group bacterium]
MKNNSKISLLDRVWSLKAVILSFGIALGIMLFVGIFWTSVKYENYDKTHHFYLNRGLFGTWAGEGSPNTKVYFPFVKVPFVETIEPLGNNKIAKIIDVSIFVPDLLVIMLICYPLALAIVRSLDKKYNFFYLIIFVLDCWLYFSWFPRV